MTDLGSEWELGKRASGKKEGRSDNGGRGSFS